jgi:tRNA (mo5U34)-methyltransferase
MLAAMSETDRLRERIARFPRWHYRFDLDGVRTPIANRRHANRHRQRRDYFFSPLVRLCGGSLAGKRVLDIGCNAGFWSLAAIEAGADHVFGIDGRQMHVDQAELVFESKGVEPSRYRFAVSDVFALDLRDEPFDIVLCLGLLYHVSRPFELIERIAQWNSDLLVIDTTLATKVAGPYFRLTNQNLGDPRSAVDRALALRPTSEAVATLVEHYGYQCAMLRPQFSNWAGSARYRKGTRRAFICAKHTRLDGLDAEPIGANARAARAWPLRRSSTSLRRLLRSFKRRVVARLSPRAPRRARRRARDRAA